MDTRPLQTFCALKQRQHGCRYGAQSKDEGALGSVPSEWTRQAF